MKKLFKILAIIIIVLLISIAVIPYAFKGKIVDTAKVELNKSVNATIDFDDFGLSLFRNFPNFTLSIKGLDVKGKDEFEGLTLANIAELQIIIDLSSVISGSSYNIKSIRINEPSLAIKVLKGGKANWDIALETDSEIDETSVEEESSSFNLSLQEFSISNAVLSYDDADLDFSLLINNLNHTLNGDLSANSTSLNTSTKIESLDLSYEGVKYLKNANTSVDAILLADLDKLIFTFKEGKIQLNELFLGVAGSFGMPEDGYSMDLSFNAEKNKFKNFLSMIPAVYSKDFESIETEGTLAINGKVSGLYNDNSMPAINLEINIADAMFKYPDLPDAVNNIAINTIIQTKGGESEDASIDIKNFHVEMAGNPVDIKMLVNSYSNDTELSGQITGKIDLSSIQKIYPLEDGENLSGIINSNLKLQGKLSSIENEQYEDFTSSGKLIISNIIYKSTDFPQGAIIKNASLLFSPMFVNLENFNAKIGKSDISASGRIDNILSYVLNDEVIKGSFSLKSSLLDLNEFIEEEDENPTTNSDTPEAEEEALSIIEIPGNIDFTLTTSINKLLYDNMDMRNVSGIVVIRDNKAMLKNLNINMLEGLVTVNGSYDTKESKKPIVDFDLDISQFDIQKTFKTFATVQKFAPIAERTAGKFSSAMKIKTPLDKEMMPIYNSLSGGGKLKTSAITIENAPALNKLGDALKIDMFKKAYMNEVDIEFEIKDGKLNVKPFDLAMNSSKINIGGYNTFDQKILYDLKIDIPRKSFGGAANGALSNLVSQANSKGGNLSLGEMVNIDAILSGTVTKPEIKLGLKGGANNALEDAKKKAKEELDKKKKEMEEKARKEAERLKNEAKNKAKAEAEKAKQKAKNEADRLKREAEEKARKEAERLKEEAKKKAKDKLKGFLK